MLESRRLQNKRRSSLGEIHQHLNTFPGEVRFTLWTPLQPEEIATEVRPFLADEAAPWDLGPKLLGRLSTRGMSLRWLHPCGKDVPQFLASYRPYRSGTVLKGVVVPSRPTRIDLWVMFALALIQVVALTVYFALLTTSPEWPSILVSATTSIAITAAVIAVMILRAVAARRSVRGIAPWYRRLLVDVLMAKDLGSDE